MAQTKPENIPHGLSVQDVLFVIFKHKWKIIFCTLMGLGAASYAYLKHAPTYESEAKLLVKYVMDTSPQDRVESNTAGSGRANDSAIGAEVEILTSWDLASQVAEAVGVDQLAPGVHGQPGNINQAAQAVQSGLSVSGPHGNVITVAFKSTNPALATKVLQELISRYFIMHLAVHRPSSAIESVNQQADQARGRLAQTEDELKRLMDKAGIVSLTDSTAANSADVARAQASLDLAVTERAEQSARLKTLEQSMSAPSGDARTPGQSPSPGGTSPAVKQASNADIQEYQALVTRLNVARQNELELLAKFRPENQLVQSAHAQIDGLEHRRAALAARLPDLINKVAAVGMGSLAPQGPDLLAERTNLAALDARTATLKSQLEAAQKRSAQIADATPQIVQLQRQKELEENDYRFATQAVQQATVTLTLDPSKLPNINVVQKPSPALRTSGDLTKTLVQLAGGGLALGLGLAFLIEMVLDQTIKRSSEFERRLHIPLLLSIPYMKNGRAMRQLQLQASNGEAGTSKAIQQVPRKKLAPWEPGHFIRPYAEAIRDRVGLYFELNDLTHKPKLVAVTGFSEGGGTSTIAGGVAAALSEMGDGKVLLVDMNVGEPELHPFFEGKPAYSLSTALEPSTPITPAADNLYLATPFTTSDHGNDNKQVQLSPRRLYELMPTLRASDFDYIVFDMPALDQSSLAVSMASLMDKVLLVTEAEKCGAGMVRRAYQELTSIRTNVSCVLNKTRSYGPKMIKAEA